MKHNMIKGYLFAVLSAVIYGCMPLMARQIYAEGISPFMLVMLRNCFSVLPLAILAYRACGTLKIAPGLLPSVGLISLLGCSVTPLLLFFSYNFIPSGTATVFHFVYPALVVVLEILIFRKKPRPAGIISVVLCIGGICLFYTPQEALNLTGCGLALASGLTFAAYVALLSHFRGGIPQFLFTFYVVLISSIFMLLFCLSTRQLLPTTLRGWLLCLLFSLTVTTGAVVLFQQSAFLIGGERVSILSTLEPITSLLIGVMVFREPLGSRALLGSALVIAASVLTALADILQTKSLTKQED